LAVISLRASISIRAPLTYRWGSVEAPRLQTISGRGVWPESVLLTLAPAAMRVWMVSRCACHEAMLSAERVSRKGELGFGASAEEGVDGLCEVLAGGEAEWGLVVGGARVYVGVVREEGACDGGGEGVAEVTGVYEDVEGGVAVGGSACVGVGAVF
jgi:hypothetical protein